MIARVLLVATMTAILMAACGGGDDADPTTTKQGTAAESTVESAMTATSSTDRTPQAPTPGSAGDCLGLTFDQAQQLSAFDLVQPTNVPQSMVLAYVDVTSPVVPQPNSTPTPCDGSKRVTLTYRPATNPSGSAELIQLIETTNPRAPHADETPVTIGDRTVRTKSEPAATSGRTNYVYVWVDGDVTLELLASIGPNVTQQQLEDMIASIPMPAA